MMRVTFLGATGTVTGSKYLVEIGAQRVLLDCGLFQGYKQLRLRNWERLPIDPAGLDGVILTHAHIDHSGYLPLLVRNGFKGRVYCTPGTQDLCGILLPDSGFLQEQDAAFANRHRTSKHHPALPLYTQEDARVALKHLSPIDYGIEHGFGDFSITFRNAGHILGAASVMIRHGGMSLLFSGDVGRPADPVTLAPEPIGEADHIVVESTYGDRIHDPRDPAGVLADIVNRTAGRGGTLVIPAFAVGRAQMLLYYLARLKAARHIPDLPVYLDSPMAIEASEMLYRHRGEHRLSDADCRALAEVARETPSVAESKAIDANPVPKIVVSASGMATGGRVLHHLRVFASDRRNTILFAGFQAGGTRGAAMIAGAESVKIFGEYVPVRAEVANLDMLSAHADAGELLDWLATCSGTPRSVYVTHGEPAAADALRKRVDERFGWPCRVPDYRDSVALS